MAQLTIKGHVTRGGEVIETLEMLGGKNKGELKGTDTNLVYYIHSEGYIATLYSTSSKHYKTFTIEEFFEEFPYKVGDKVQHKGATSCGSVFEVEKMRWEEDTIKYTLRLFGCNYKSSTLTVEYLQPYKEEQKKDYDEWFPTDYLEFENNDDTWADEVEINLGKDYEIQFRGDKTFIVKKKLQYPKSYKECCKVMGIDPNNYLSIRKLHSDDGEEETTNYEQDFLDIFDSLWKVKICRDVYWEIAGEQMGLGKPWEPPYGCEPVEIFCVHTYQNRITRVSDNSSYHYILAFPTVEMRDVFYENFKDLIEECKTFL